MPTPLPADRSAVISKALLRAADLLGLSAPALTRSIGVPEVTVTRLRAGTRFLEVGTKPYELALLLIRVYQGLGTLVGGDDASRRSWMAADSLVLGGTPRDLVQTVVGLVATLDHLDGAAAGHGSTAFRSHRLGAAVARAAQTDPAALSALIDDVLAATRAQAVEIATGQVRGVLAAHAEEPAARFERVMAIATAVWGDGAAAQDWLTRPHRLLGGRTPLGTASTEAGAGAGAVQVERILRNLQHGLPV
jgi:putative toxin-antitoxin system antitoxin component (TIGR02293 family)